jgi:hypothetical protein
MGVRNNKCQPIEIGDVTQGGVTRNYGLDCGQEQLYYEAIISPLPTVTITADQDIAFGTIACQAVLVIEQGDGTIITRNIPSGTRDEFDSLHLTVPDVRRVFVRCEEVEGGTNCQGLLRFTVHYCECTDICCTCIEGKPVVIGDNSRNLTSNFNIPCGTETTQLYETFLPCPPTVTIIPLDLDFSGTACDTILVVELDDGTIIERDISAENAGDNTPPFFTIEDVREVRLRCEGDQNVNCTGIVSFIVSYC